MDTEVKPSKKSARKVTPSDGGLTVIKPANILRATIEIAGTAPLVQNKFSHKAGEMMKARMAATQAERL